MKTLKIGVIMLVLFMSVGLACAANETSDDIMGDDNHNTIGAVQNDASTVAVSKTFTDLENDINVSTGVFDVMDDYKFNSDTDENCTGIFIRENLIINGNGHKIDADDQIGIFRIFASNVTINNLTIVNGNAMMASAIYVGVNCSLTTNNIYVANNTARDGVVTVEGTYTSNNDRFVDCTASMGVVKIYGPQFTANNVTMQSSSILNWGFIYTENDGVSITVLNSTFANTVSNYATAIKATTRTVIRNSKFINLQALISAGAIGLKCVGEAEIDNCTFINVTSMKNGGAIVADVFGNNQIGGNVKITNSDFVDCCSDFGGALMILGGNLTMDKCTFKNSSAKFDGGAIYMSMTNSSISNSAFEESYTVYDGSRGTFGGAIYCDNSTLMLCGNEFINSIAQYGGALYCYDSSYYVIGNNFSGNKKPNGTYDDVYTEFDVVSVMQGNKYSGNESRDLNNTKYATIVVANGLKINLINNTIDVVVLPSRFDLRDWNWSTPVRDQGRAGSCWTFGASGAMESAILRFLGIEMDLSENNLEDISLQYNHYGIWGAVESGFPETAVAYAVSWFGVFPSEYDQYDQMGKISPIIVANGAVHFQDVIFIPGRVNVTDNDVLKRAILKYGALDIVYAADQGPPELNLETSAQYNNETEPEDHSVTLIGWDDNYPASNFIITPPKNGAWIIKNSWGEQSGDYGYYYISYYDVNFLFDTSVAFLFENTVEYNKNYQYDVMGILDFKNATEYVNQYVALADDLIAGVGTYFNETGIEYGVEVYVNGVLRHVQKGLSPFVGFHTIQLDTFIPIKKGDVFAVKIMSNSVPVLQYSRMHFLQNTSKYLQNGTWEDAYDEDEACVVKVYTVADNTKVVSIENITVEYGSGSYFTVKVVTADGHAVGAGAEVSFSFNKRNVTAKTDNEGIAKVRITEVPGTYDVITSYNGVDYKNKVTVKLNMNTCKLINNRNIVVDYLGGKYFSVKVVSADGKVAAAGATVKFTINGRTVTAKTNKYGIAKIKITDAPKKYLIVSTFNGKSIKNTVTVRHIVKTTKVVVKKTAKAFTLRAVLKINGKAQKGKMITFKFNGRNYYAKTNAYGIAQKTFNKNVIAKLVKGKTYAVQVSYIKDIVKSTVRVM